jgi:hypothetical protein
VWASRSHSPFWYSVLPLMKPTLVTLLAASLALLPGCGTPGPPLPPSLDLPQAVTDLRASRKADKVYLVWTIPSRTTDHDRARHLGVTHICRSLAPTISNCAIPLAEVPAPVPPPRSNKNKSGKDSQKIQAGYTDILSHDLEEQDPTAQISYAVSVLNTRGRTAGLSNQVQVPVAPTLAPPSDFAAEVTAQGVRISWSCQAAIGAPPSLQYRIRVYRRLESGKADSRVGETDGQDCSKMEMLDQTIEWEKNYTYRGTVVTVVSSPEKQAFEVEGEDTPLVKVFTRDIFPPAVPSGLQAVFSGVGQAPFVDLIWAPDSDVDLAGYNVYRREEGGGPTKVNPELLKAPAFRDTSVDPGKRYSYSVTAVDLRGNESARSDEVSEAVP